MVLATFETLNWTFTVLGRDRAHATLLLTDAWEEHQRQTGATLEVWEVLDSASFYDVEIGTVLRDGSPFPAS